MSQTPIKVRTCCVASSCLIENLIKFVQLNIWYILEFHSWFILYDILKTTKEKKSAMFIDVMGSLFIGDLGMVSREEELSLEMACAPKFMQQTIKIVVTKMGRRIAAIVGFSPKIY